MSISIIWYNSISNTLTHCTNLFNSTYSDQDDSWDIIYLAISRGIPIICSNAYEGRLCYLIIRVWLVSSLRLREMLWMWCLWIDVFRWLITIFLSLFLLEANLDCQCISDRCIYSFRITWILECILYFLSEGIVRRFY